MSQQSRCSFLYTKISCVAGIVQLCKQKLAYATRPRNHKLIYMWFWCMIHKLQAMNFTEAEMAIITTALVTSFLHGGVGRILLSLVYHSKPARFDSQCVHPGLMAIHL